MQSLGWIPFLMHGVYGLNILQDNNYANHFGLKFLIMANSQ
jgi:hypothetical protein